VVGICALPIADGGPPLKTSFRRYLSDLGLHTASDGWHSHPLPYGNFLSTPAKECALLVGDACGLADPLLGEGIFYAHRSAQLAAEAITSAAGDLRNVAPTYIRLLNTHVLRELRWVDFYRRLLFIGGRVRRFRGLTLCFRLFPRRLEALLQGERPFSRLFLP
jgi:flavin-dependent dehydrogenase